MAQFEHARDRVPHSALDFAISRQFQGVLTQRIQHTGSIFSSKALATPSFEAITQVVCDNLIHYLK